MTPVENLYAQPLPKRHRPQQQHHHHQRQQRQRRDHDHGRQSSQDVIVVAGQGSFGNLPVKRHVRQSSYVNARHCGTFKSKKVQKKLLKKICIVDGFSICHISSDYSSSDFGPNHV